MEKLGKRETLLAEAARLLAERGPDVSTRAICEAAGVTAPTLYHYFGDRAGLLDAVIGQGFGDYLDSKRALESTGDPITDLRRGWDGHTEWGITHPSHYALMFGQVRPGVLPGPAAEARDLLAEKLDAAAAAGLLLMPVAAAAEIILAANVGLTLQLIRQPALDAATLSPLARETVFASVLVLDRDRAADGIGHAAITLQAALAAAPPTNLDPAERALLDSWLGRLAINS
ncbi:AcrR family transcriptional regulator [Leifsonia sp. AK011]|uniref:TetR/AcrR family transcriptional regulator n=1 Tax=Leifsonia sp. AK011 TaxID=2723075 RepID=UPI0015CC0C8D|nr:TetR/AcrR family transcriptional regulator [Leifsonia sp. AK011]NYF09115.1 AcrR family transcriptional regulator [Leifsonia sp. AK011]